MQIHVAAWAHASGESKIIHKCKGAIRDGERAGKGVLRSRATTASDI